MSVVGVPRLGRPWDLGETGGLVAQKQKVVVFVLKSFVGVVCCVASRIWRGSGCGVKDNMAGNF